MAKKPNEIYVEQHPNGYAVLRPGAERASVITPTQREAIERAAEIAPTAAIHVERVRKTDVGHPDKWRKP
jgi:ferredoxin